MAPRWIDARPDWIHGRRPRSLEGSVLRALRRSGCGEEGHELRVEARVLARQDREARAISYRRVRHRYVERSARAESRRRAGEVRDERQDPGTVARSAEVIQGTANR